MHSKVCTLHVKCHGQVAYGLDSGMIYAQLRSLIIFTTVGNVEYYVTLRERINSVATKALLAVCCLNHEIQLLQKSKGCLARVGQDRALAHKMHSFGDTNCLNRAQIWYNATIKRPLISHKHPGTACNSTIAVSLPQCEGLASETTFELLSASSQSEHGYS